MKKFAVVWKKIGETPLQAIEAYRTGEKLNADIPLAYAGRLDPMAEGKLLVLIGDECKKLKEYTGLDKEYAFEILFGFSSDTGDVLGIVKQHPLDKFPELSLIKQSVQQFRGTHTFPYPAFSSKTVGGKQLHKWALENRLCEIEIPQKQSTIYNLRNLGVYTIRKDNLQKTINNKIQSISRVTDREKEWGSDFRREPILVRWKDVLEHHDQNEFFIARFSAIVSSGTYIRTLAEKIAESLGTKGLAYSIRREKIGQYTNLGSFSFWKKKF